AGTVCAQTSTPQSKFSTRQKQPVPVNPQPAKMMNPRKLQRVDPPKPKAECPPLPFLARNNSDLFTGEADHLGFDPIPAKKRGHENYEYMSPVNGYYEIDRSVNINHRVIRFL